MASPKEKMPSPSELFTMPLEEREKWIQRSFALAANEDFEIFEAFDEEDNSITAE